MTTEMSQEDEEELQRYLNIDSANMPNSMAVNQDQMAQEASSALPEQPRSKYYGVYNNNSGNQSHMPFRAALRLGSKASARWVPLGYFKCEHVTAIAYNVAAINYFGKGAWLNPVDTEKCDSTEYARFRELRADYIADSVTKLKAMHANGEHPNTVDLDREIDTTATEAVAS